MRKLHDLTLREIRQRFGAATTAAHQVAVAAGKERPRPDARMQAISKPLKGASRKRD